MLNEQQEEAKKLIIDWFNKKEKPYFVLAGYAGTGKTFLIQHIIESLEITNKVAFITPTGKAASVLIQRGVSNASTIHKLIYNLVEKEIIIENNGKKIKSKKTEFIKKQRIPEYKMLILDEVSMVEKSIMEDLLSFRIPILCSGDISQLPPIFKSNGLLENPNYILTKIVRQSEENSIIRLATMARNKQPIKEGNYGNAIVFNKYFLKEEYLKKLMLNADQILCGTNKTRRNLNLKMKEYLGLDKNKLNDNEKVICLLNNWAVSLDSEFNVITNSQCFADLLGCLANIPEFGNFVPNEKH